MRTSRLVFISLVALSIGQAAVYYPQLPDKMASHFGIAGNADGWMPKPVFFIFEFVVQGILLLLFLIMPISIMKLPVSCINLPHKDYWLDPVRKAATQNIFRTP